MSKWITLFSVMFLSTALFAVNDQALKDKDINFSLPVDWTGTNKVNLLVKIPEGFESIQPFDQWENAAMIEFIPKGEDKNNWSEIVTVHKFLNKGISASDLSKGIAEYISKQSKDYKVLKNLDATENGYVMSGKVLSYNFQEKNEVLGYKYYSGPADCVGVQYTIRPKATETNEQIAARIESFLASSATIIPNAPATDDTSVEDEDSSDTDVDSSDESDEDSADDEGDYQDEDSSDAE